MASPATTETSPAADPEVGYPHGHLGHLTEEEAKAFQDFKTYLAEKGDYRAGPTPSHDDQTLLRFLRARRWIVEDAYRQFKDTEDWRTATRLDLLYDTIDLDSYEQARALYPQWTGRRDRRGIPLYLFEIRHLDSKTVASYEKSADDTYSKAHGDGSTPPKLLRLFALYENLTRFVQPLCTEMTDRSHSGVTPITLSTNIVDVSGVSLRQFWNLKSHMQAASTVATAHYPETLDRIFIIGAPIFFSTVWGWIKRWFDPITVSKIFILSKSEVFPTLTSFIDPKHIPREYGGELDFRWGKEPNLDPAIVAAATWENGFERFPRGPVYWRPVEGDVSRLECIAVGSVEQKQRRIRVCTIPRSFKGATATNSPYHAPEAATPTVTDEAALAEAPPANKPANGIASVGLTITEIQGVQDLSLAEAKAAGEPSKSDLNEKLASEESSVPVPQTKIAA